jgi:ubiquinone/menaquinone biosynthesis C-methylase UbiE
MAIDYSRIAYSYDSADFRQVTDVDPIIAGLIDSKPTSISVLDLGCGTGSYIKVNQLHFKDKVLLHGLDKSSSMLERARNKNILSLILGDACEGLPYVTSFLITYHADMLSITSRIKNLL